MNAEKEMHVEQPVPLRRTTLVMVQIIILSVFLDQLSKYLIQENIAQGQVIPIIPGCFNLTLTYNPGAAFGLMGNLPDGTRQFVLLLVTALALGVVFYFLIKDYYHDIVAQGALGLILGGAIGNIVDRVVLGRVVDFLDVYISKYHWPSFNVADSAICIGVAILIFRRPARREEASEAPKE